MDHLACRLLNLQAHPAGLFPCSYPIFRFTIADSITNLVFSGHLVELFISLSCKTKQSRVLRQTDRIGKIVIFSLVINGEDGKTAVTFEFEPDVLIVCAVFNKDRLEEINRFIREIYISRAKLYLDQVICMSVITQERIIAAIM